MSVDDSRLIGEVVASMGSDPSLSRRQAIIRVAGEDSLRRLEMKLKRLDDEGGLGAELRRVIAERHAEEHPMDARQGAGFGVRMGAEGVVAIDIDAGGRLSVTCRDKRVPTEDSEWDDDLRRHRRGYAALLDLGAVWPVRGAVDRTSAVPPFMATLAARLAQAWSAVPAAVADLASEEVGRLALETETARADRAGYAAFADRWSGSVKDAVTLLVDRGHSWAAVGRCLREPAFARAIADAGPLFEVFFHHGRIAIEPRPDETAEAFFARAVYASRLRVDTGDYTSRHADAGDVAWLRETFAREPMGAFGADALTEIVRLRLSLDPARMQDVASKIALGSLLSGRHYNVDGRHFRSEQMLEALHRGEGSYADIEARVKALAADGRMTFDEALGLVCTGWEPLAISLRHGVAVPLATTRIPAERVPDGVSVHELADSMLPWRKAPHDLVMEAVTAGCPFETARRMLAWRDAGRPGQQPTGSEARYDDGWLVRASRKPEYGEGDVAAVYEALRPYLADPTISFPAFEARVMEVCRSPDEVLSDWTEVRAREALRYGVEPARRGGRLRRAWNALFGPGDAKASAC